MKRPFAALFPVALAAALLPGGDALPCNPADAGFAPDARPPAGDVLVWSRNVSPREDRDQLPTNMRFVVTYTVGGKPGATLDWLGELTLRDGQGADLPVDVVRLPGGTYEARFQVTPRQPLPPFAAVTLHDRFAAIPCGVEAVCARGELAQIAYYKTGPGPDVAKPRLAAQTIVLNGWGSFSYTDTCTSMTCSGLEARVAFVRATDDTDDEITYRFRYPDGTVRESTEPVEDQRVECAGCVHPGGFPSPAPVQLGPIEVSAVDWVGHESEGRVVLELAAPRCTATPPADAGPALDAEGGGGCAVGGSASPGSALLLAALIAFARRRR